MFLYWKLVNSVRERHLDTYMTDFLDLCCNWEINPTVLLKPDVNWDFRLHCESFLILIKKFWIIKNKNKKCCDSSYKLNTWRGFLHTIDIFSSLFKWWVLVNHTWKKLMLGLSPMLPSVISKPGPSSIGCLSSSKRCSGLPSSSLGLCYQLGPHQH